MSSISDGYYQIGTKCTKQNGTQIYLYYGCMFSTDCKGNRPPCYGKKECPGDKGTGECSCGNKKYFESCTDTCDGSGLSANDGYCVAPKTTDCTGNGTCGYYTVKPKCTNTEGISYVYAKSCKDTSKDCNGNTPPCAGYKECPQGSTGSGESCSCGSETYYKSCSTCDTTGTTIDGDYYSATDNANGLGSGYTTVRFKCTKSDGNSVYYYTSCNADKSLAPCKGYVSSCTSGLILGGRECKCGGNTYREYCLAECPYEDTAETCAAQGKEFESKCHGDGANESEWIWYGICK